MTIEELIEKSNESGITITSSMASQLQTYAELLKEWNEKINLTSITEKEEVFEKHFYDSILPLNDKVNGHAADVGTGAGFPGLVWKIVRPELKVTLIEPTGKRCTFLNAVISELGLKDIQVVNERAEDHAKKNREKYDVVTARAVSNLNLLSELCVPLVKKGGYFVALKGMQGEAEAENAKSAMQILGAVLEECELTQLPNGDQRVNLYYKKEKTTPAKYPRNYGQMKKKPL